MDKDLSQWILAYLTYSILKNVPISQKIKNQTNVRLFSVTVNLYINNL